MTRYSFWTLVERQAAPSGFRQAGLRPAIDRELSHTLHRLTSRLVKQFSQWRLRPRATSLFGRAWSALGIQREPYPRRIANSLRPQVHTLLRLTQRSSLVLHWFAPRPPDAQFAQFFLQALPVQTNCRCCARNIPAMACQLFGNPSDFKFALRFAEVALVHSGIHMPVRFSLRDRPASCDFVWQIVCINLAAGRQDHASLNRVLQFAHIPRPIITLKRRICLTAQLYIAIQTLAMHLHKSFREHGNVFFEVPQGWKLD